MQRKLASLKRVTEIRRIILADEIECAMIGGWPTVVKKGEFRVGDLAVYFEIDSWIPYTLAPFLCRGKEPREFNGVKGERLRTIRLRGQLSQGLLLSMDACGVEGDEGDDLSEYLGVQKWEKPIPVALQGQQKGSFPSFIRKTDQERVQNLDGMIDWDAVYEVTIKLDGSSMTIYKKDGEIGVCSRNVELKMDQDGNAFVDMAKTIDTTLWPDGIAVQGELMGPGIQGNREGMTSHGFFVFDVWDIDGQCYWPSDIVLEFCGNNMLEHVPVIYHGSRLSRMGVKSVDVALSWAEGESLSNPVREGIVFKREDGGFSFKAISNAFLLGEK